MDTSRQIRSIGVTILGVILSVSAVAAATYHAAWEQDRQMNAACAGYAVGGYRTTCGTSTCLTETTPNASGPPRLEHVWVFLNIPAGQYCLNVSGSVDLIGGNNDPEQFQFLWNTFTPGDQTEAFAYIAIDNSLNDLASTPFSCGVTTTSATKDIHVIVSDHGLTNDTTTSHITIDSISLSTCTFAANYCEQL